MRSQALLALAPVLAALAVAGCGAKAQQGPGPAPPPAQVSVAEVAFKDLRAWDDFTGRLEPIETVEVRPRVGGYIDSIQFKEGERVHKGQVLFQIDARPFKAEVDRLAADVDRYKAKLDLAVANRDRGKRLIDQNAVATSEFERVQAEEKSARADLASAEAALRAAQLNLEFTRVVSPIDGRASKAVITRGNLVTSADLLTTVVSDTPIYASFNADEQTFLKYASSQRGKEGPVYLGLMTEEGYPHQGKLHFLDNAVDAKSGTISGRAIFDNQDGAFTPGLFARIRLVSQETENVGLAPDKAIGTDLGKRFVLVLGPQNKAIYREVTLGPLVDGGARIVRSGLKRGDVIILNGLQKVRPGDTVAPVRTQAALSAAAIAQLSSAGPQAGPSVRSN
jgi:RND family efflux transporter MFP subunit